MLAFLVKCDTDDAQSIFSVHVGQLCSAEATLWGGGPSASPETVCKHSGRTVHTRRSPSGNAEPNHRASPRGREAPRWVGNWCDTRGAEREWKGTWVGLTEEKALGPILNPRRAARGLEELMPQT